MSAYVCVCGGGGVTQNEVKKIECVYGNAKAIGALLERSLNILRMFSCIFTHDHFYFILFFSQTSATCKCVLEIKMVI